MTTFICGYWKIKNNVKHSYDLNIHNIANFKKIYINNFLENMNETNFESAKKFIDMKIKHQTNTCEI